MFLTMLGSLRYSANRLTYHELLQVKGSNRSSVKFENGFEMGFENGFEM